MAQFETVGGATMYEESGPGELLSVREVGERYGISRSTLYRYIRRGSIHTYRRGIGRETYVPRSELDTLQAVRPRPESAPAESQMNDQAEDAMRISEALVASGQETVYALPRSGPNGETLTYYVRQRDIPPPTHQRRRAAIQRALAVFGAWSDLDPNPVFDALDRIRHESTQTPPIDEASLFGLS